MNFSERPPERTAIVHPWVQHVRGGEKVFFELARAFPSADLYLLHCRPERLPSDIRPRLVGTSFLQRFPFHSMPYRSLLPLLPLAVESLDLFRYELIVSSVSGWTHGVIPADTARHVSYVHSPPRYLWSRELPGRSRRNSALAPLLAPLMQYLRMWDVAAATRVDAMIANSQTTAQRIHRRYGTSADVIHPPVETSRFLGLKRAPSGYLLSVGELVAYKRVDLAIRAARLARVPLIVAGDGPERSRLEALAAGGDVRFVGRVSDRALDALYSGASAFVHAGIEDFGIVTVEALAAGLPVVGRSTGGTAEIVPPGMGVLVDSDTPEAFAEAITEATCLSLSPAQRREVALRFSPQAFHQAVRGHVAQTRVGRPASPGEIAA